MSLLKHLNHKTALKEPIYHLIHMKINNHFLEGENVKESPTTEKISGKFKPGLPDTVIIHYTASYGFQSAYDTLMKPDHKASAHLLIDYDGSLVQMAGFDEITWHAGASQFHGRKFLNPYSIGIEIVNPGPLLEVKGEEYFKDIYKHKVYPEWVCESAHRNAYIEKGNFWHRFTTQQYEVVHEICTLLKNLYGVKFILGHEEISPGRKQDPGPAFPLDQLRGEIFKYGESIALPPAPVLVDYFAATTKPKLKYGANDQTPPRKRATGATQRNIPKPPTVKTSNSQTNTAWAFGKYIQPISNNQGTITASALNIRTAPSTQAGIAGDPLLKGSIVNIVSTQGPWVEIRKP